MATSACQALFNQFVCCCGADTIQSIYRAKPEDVITKFIKNRVLVKNFNYVTNKYDGAQVWKLNAAFLLFAGPDFTKETQDGQYYGGVKLLAEYIRKENLGNVLETAHKWNPMHPERKAGEGDLVIYIWEIDEPALKAWWTTRHPLDVSTGTTLGTTPTKVEPLK